MSVSLNNVGQQENALGRREAAYELYQESLKIRRRLQETLGETPETLRDLSVSLNYVADQETILEKNQQAKGHFEECLILLKRLHVALPDDKEYSEMIVIIEEKLGLS
jgi:tetratricopeptide (TPR) repeat protein